MNFNVIDSCGGTRYLIFEAAGQIPVIYMWSRPGGDDLNQVTKRYDRLITERHNRLIQLSKSLHFGEWTIPITNSHKEILQ